MLSDRESGAPPPISAGPARPSERRWGLAAATLGCGLVAVGTLAFPVLEALSTALGVTALTSGIGACMRSTRAESILRTFACLGAVLGTVAAITAIARVDKTIIDLDQQQLERRVPPLPTPGTGSRSPVPHREGKQPGASSRPDRSRQPG